VQDTSLCMSQVLLCLILLITPWDRYYIYPYFGDESNKQNQDLNNLITEYIVLIAILNWDKIDREAKRNQAVSRR
jgi:hypothetical protein